MIGRVYHLHSFILSSSPYFRKMLSGPWKEGKKGKVDIQFPCDHHITHDVVDILMAYLYGFQVFFPFLSLSFFSLTLSLYISTYTHIYIQIKTHSRTHIHTHREGIKRDLICLANFYSPKCVGHPHSHPFIHIPKICTKNKQNQNSTKKFRSNPSHKKREEKEKYTNTTHTTC